MTTGLLARRLGVGFLLVMLGLAPLAGCDNDTSDHDNDASNGGGDNGSNDGGGNDDGGSDDGGDNGGDNGSPPTPTLVITSDNATAVLIQSRMALDLLPRLLVGANVFYSNSIAVQGYDDFPPCDNAEGQVQLLGDNPGQPTTLIASDCDDLSYPRNFNGRLDLDFSNADDPLSTFTGFAERIQAYDPNLRLSANGGLRLHPEVPDDYFGIAVAHQADIDITLELLPGGSDTPITSLGFDFHDYTSRYSSSIHFDDVPFPLLSGAGDVTFRGLAEGRVTLTTPRQLTDPDASNPLCYGDGVIEVEGAEGSSVRLDYNGAQAILSVNGALLASGDCTDLTQQWTSQVAASLPPYR
ncbi:hypothetical protein [Alloalcanivorax mobilis]|uniref:hypothetical protein n=1 Tax=Alloalcanivorax mobilis TaxID=2019569 RepID=UPI0012FFDDCB|nr:hypothetical protein [Alloalcanivorax mobilis]